MQHEEETAAVADAAHLVPDEDVPGGEEEEALEEAAGEGEQVTGEAPVDEMEHDADQGALPETPEDANQDDEARAGAADEGAPGVDMEDLEDEGAAEQQEAAPDGAVAPPVLEESAAPATSSDAMPAPMPAASMDAERVAAEATPNTQTGAGADPTANEDRTAGQPNNMGGQAQGDGEGGPGEGGSGQPPQKKPRLIEWKPQSAPEAPQPAPRTAAAFPSLVPPAAVAGRLPASNSPARPGRGTGRGRVGARGRTARGGDRTARGGGRRPPAQDGNTPPQPDT